MRISVILCTYNGEHYLFEQLESIAAQTRLPDELIICDDGSTDRTRSILDVFAAQAAFPVLVYYNTRNLGSTRNFEQALRLVNGDIIAFADQDDYWYQHKLAVLESAMRQSPRAGFVFSDADVVDSERRPLEVRLWQSVRFSASEQEQAARGEFANVLLRHPVVTGATMAFRTQWRDLFLPIPENWIHDAWISFWITLMADVIVIPEPLMQYRQHTLNQIGISGRTRLDRMRVALKTDPQIYQLLYERYSVLLERLEQSPHIAHDILPAVRTKLQHLNARRNMPRNRVARFPVILRELFSGHYKHYSGSALNAIRDLLLTHDARTPP
ncbi:MAG: glycosyltransferase family 2 protein [Anaerolineae bacterium]|nr:glycosyltransferase family 2 protein [Anaerolineae bacterium]